MENNLDLIMDFGGFFGFFAKILLLSMNGLHAMHLSYGWSIIAITIVIKLLFWPLTNASTRSMKRMAALQPQMKALQEKYKDDPKKMNQKLMEFMKENRVSPMSGCFPIILQIPVFFGFYKMLQSAIELRGASFLWARDLSQPDTIASIPGLDFPINPLPLIMGATMLWQSHLTPPSPGMDPMQQKIMKYMPLMFIVFLYNFSAGLSLYWTVQNLLSIAQMKLTRSAGTGAGTSAPAGATLPAAGTGSRPQKKRH
jgi:YidC/Oxa1 family membrane protein insertase